MILRSFLSLKTYCEESDYSGWDPYDGLNSRIFQATPFRKWNLARLIWIQGFKRSPINFRKLLWVPKGHNAKGIGLFLTGYCNLYKLQHSTGKDVFGTQKEILSKIHYLSELLLSLGSKGYSGVCWGYNFDWQNRVFFQPKYTPTIVATSFCADALFNAFDITSDEKYLKAALSACDFVLKDLYRSYKSESDFIFSYSPKDKSQVYNASLLGARLLARGSSYSDNNEWRKLSIIATRTIVNLQNEDGSWIYGEASMQNWIDSFHTGFNLECIYEVMEYLNIDIFQNEFEKGLNYYLKSFFLKNGTPKYYNNEIYPIDIHSPAQFIATLSRTQKIQLHMNIAKKVLDWTIINMQSKDGFFFYQRNKFVPSKIPYMRWSQAWMFYSFTEYFKNLNHEDLG